MPHADVASCESLFGRRQYRPFFENRSMDVAIVDVPWNGLAESVKIASMADAYEINCAPHNFYGHLATMMGAHLAAVIPNFSIMEADIDDVPWKDDLVTQVPVIESGIMTVPQGPAGARYHEDAPRISMISSFLDRETVVPPTHIGRKVRQSPTGGVATRRASSATRGQAD